MPIFVIPVRVLEASGGMFCVRTFVASGYGIFSGDDVVADDNGGFFRNFRAINGVQPQKGLGLSGDPS